MPEVSPVGGDGPVGGFVRPRVSRVCCLRTALGPFRGRGFRCLVVGMRVGDYGEGDDPGGDFESSTVCVPGEAVFLPGTG